MFGGGIGVSSGDGVSSCSVAGLVMSWKSTLGSNWRAVGIFNLGEVRNPCSKDPKLLARRVAVIVGDLGSLGPSSCSSLATTRSVDAPGKSQDWIKS